MVKVHKTVESSEISDFYQIKCRIFAEKVLNILKIVPITDMVGGVTAMRRGNMDIVAKGGLVPASIPQFDYEQERWATARSANVEKIAEAWRDNPTLVKVFRDYKFGHNHLVLMRKDKFEHMLKLLHDLQNGQAAVQFDLSMLLGAVGIMESIVEKEKQALPKGFSKPILQTIKHIINIKSSISAKILVRAPRPKIEPSPLSEEEKFPLED